MKYSKLQVKTLIKEIEYYFQYDNSLDENTKVNFLRSLESLEEKDYNLKKLKTKELKVLDLIKYYFLTHTDQWGNIISLMHHAHINNEISENIEELKHLENKFLQHLFAVTKPLYFLDVDNTLTDNAYLSPQKIEFIKNWKYKQDIILNTGKVSSSIMNVIEACGLQSNYYSCLNGSVIVKDNMIEIISRIGELSKKIIDDLLVTDLNFIVYYEDQIHVVRQLTDENIDLLKKFNEWFIDDKQPTDYNRVVKILTFVNEEEVEKEELVKSIAQKYPNLVGVRTAAHCFEILNVDQHKGNSVKKISGYLNRYYRASIGVGDSMNDLRMLDYVGFPYVVSNASKELKEYGFETLERNRDIDIVNILKKHEK